MSAGTSGNFVPVESANTRFVLPTNDPFLTWAQTGAIFKDAKHPAAAKLYVSWMLSLPVASNPRQFPIRKDVAQESVRAADRTGAGHFAAEGLRR